MTSASMRVAAAPSARTRLLLEGPIVGTLLRLAPANLVVNVVLIAVTASVDAHFVGQLGTEALAGLSLVFPPLMLMQQMANGTMGGAIAAVEHGLVEDQDRARQRLLERGQLAEGDPFVLVL